MDAVFSSWYRSKEGFHHGFCMRASFHENLARGSDVQPGSNRAFGLVIATACCIVAVFGFWAGTAHWAFWLGAAVALAVAAWKWPGLLAPLNQLWFRLGLALHRVVNPLVMGLLFFVVITPVGLLLRLWNRRPLALGFEREGASYWLIRDKSEMQPGPMTKQY